MITFKQKGDFSNLTRYLERAKNVVKIGDLDRFGREGVDAPVNPDNACPLRITAAAGT